MQALPSELYDVIERASENEVELHFPLTSLTMLQRIAMGIGSAQNMTVRLVYIDDAISGLCIHLDNEAKELEDAYRTPGAWKDDPLLRPQEHYPIVILGLEEGKPSQPLRKQPLSSITLLRLEHKCLNVRLL